MGSDLYGPVCPPVRFFKNSPAPPGGQPNFFFLGLHPLSTVVCSSGAHPPILFPFTRLFSALFFSPSPSHAFCSIFLSSLLNTFLARAMLHHEEFIKNVPSVKQATKQTPPIDRCCATLLLGLENHL
ncbi:hypothetical protein M513_04219 [Trichuris suis]|uniref:Uncharacterized protein n=1 Tax=Trichuris suis TaxID=68888 RepID=A0A085MCU1_9BILA|nr:hypothetical protein M513_04219 [Trichuris suis]